MSEAITKAIDQQPSFAGKVVYLKENKKLGTAGSLSLLPEQPTVPLVVMNGDLLTKANLSEMMNFHNYEHNVMTVALKEEKVEIPYGVAKLEGTRIIQLQEKPKYIHFINAGIYIIEPFIIDRIPKDTYYDMNTLIEKLIAADLRVGSFPVHEYWLDIGRVVDYEKACNDAQNNRS
jgi:NDP-sugar pyrophosphorylase family protein